MTKTDIEWLEYANQFHYGNHPEINTAVKHTIEALERTRWIPVSERLPEEKDSNEFGYVLVVTRYGSIRTDKAEWVADKEGRRFFTHWMPLPNPPQEVE